MVVSEPTQVGVDGGREMFGRKIGGLIKVLGRPGVSGSAVSYISMGERRRERGVIGLCEQKRPELIHNALASRASARKQVSCPKGQQGGALSGENAIHNNATKALLTNKRAITGKSAGGEHRV